MHTFTDGDTNESVEETVERLSEIAGETSADEAEDDQTLEENAVALIERAEGATESLLMASNEGTVTELREDAEELQNVIEQTRELLETADLTEVAGAIDDDDIDDAISVSDIPNAIAEKDPEEAIRYSKLLHLVEFEELLDTIDVRELQQDKDEFDAAVAEFVDDRNEDSSWIVFDALKWLVESAVGGDGEIVDSISDADAAKLASGTGDEGQMKQVAMQSKLLDAVEEFRESVLDAREQLEELREQATENIPENGPGQPSSRNPTAYSTLPQQERPRVETKVSTVPRDTRYSTVSNPPRIYGSRFDTWSKNNE